MSGYNINDSKTSLFGDDYSKKSIQELKQSRKIDM